MGLSLPAPIVNADPSVQQNFDEISRRWPGFSAGRKIAFPFSANWSDLAAQYPCTYRKDSAGVVWLEGIAKAAVLVANDTFTLMGTLPAGFRPVSPSGPTSEKYLTATLYKAPGYQAGLVRIDNSGVVNVFVPGANMNNTGQVFFDGLTFATF